MTCEDGKYRTTLTKLKSALRRAPVLQDVNLYRYRLDTSATGRLVLLDEDWREGVRLAGADDFIRRLPDGYHTMLARQRQRPLSQGQRYPLLAQQSQIHQSRF